MSLIKDKSILLSTFFLLLYFSARFSFDFLWRHFEYLPYFFEISFVALTFIFLRPEVSLLKRLAAKDFLKLSFMLVAGVSTFKGAGPLHINIPFDFSGMITLLFLLVVAPILEELVFRFSLWECFRKLGLNSATTLILTSLLFSLGHFVAFFQTPAEVHSFIYYQTIYVFFLALFIGRQREQSNSLGLPMMLHFCFNLGFLLGSKI